MLYIKQVVANYYGNLGYYEPVPGKSIHWPGGRDTPPPDTPECGFDGTGCPTQGKLYSGLCIDLYDESLRYYGVLLYC